MHIKVGGEEHDQIKGLEICHDCGVGAQQGQDRHKGQGPDIIKKRVQRVLTKVWSRRRSSSKCTHILRDVPTCSSVVIIAVLGRKKFPLPLHILAGLRIKLTGDRLTGGKKQN